MSVLEHAEQNDRRQVVGLIKRAQLANQMRQRRKLKNQGQEQEMSEDEYRYASLLFCQLLFLNGWVLSTNVNITDAVIPYAKRKITQCIPSQVHRGAPARVL
jgi:hypothetical protein